VTGWISWPILVAGMLRAGGWTAAGSPGPGRVGPREALADPAYRAAVMSLAFNALPYLAPVALHSRPRLATPAVSARASSLTRITLTRRKTCGITPAATLASTNAVKTVGLAGGA
jgi:hypothetical protein